MVEADVGLLEDLKFELVLVVFISPYSKVETCAQGLARCVQVLWGGPLELSK